MRRRDSYGVWDGYVHTAIFKMEKQQGPAVKHRELYSVLCGSLDGRGVWGRMDTCVCVCMHTYIHIYIAESLCCAPVTITALLICYTPI